MYLFVLFSDEGVSFATQKGVAISRSLVRYFKHNDMEDLENVLKDFQKESTKVNSSFPSPLLLGLREEDIYYGIMIIEYSSSYDIF